MPLVIECDSCNTKLKVGDYLAGKKVRCPKCHATMLAPQNEADEQILEAVDVRPAARKIAPPRLTRREREDDYEEDAFDEERPAPRRRRRRRAERGNGVAVGAIIGGIIGVLVLVGVVVGVGYLVISQLGGSSIPASAWQPLTPPGAGFTVLMPGTPKVGSKNVGAIPLEHHTVEFRNSAYVVAFCNIPIGAPVDLDLTAQGFCKGVGGTLTSSSDFRLGNLKGKAFEADVVTPAKGHAVGRVIIVNNRLIQVIAMGTNISANNPDVVKFMNSFQITGK